MTQIKRPNNSDKTSSKNEALNKVTFSRWKPILWDLNVSSVRNNFEALKFLIKGKFDVFLVSESKTRFKLPRSSIQNSRLTQLSERAPQPKWTPLFTAEKFNERPSLNERPPQTRKGALIWNFAMSAEVLIQIVCLNDETRVFFS